MSLSGSEFTNKEFHSGSSTIKIGGVYGLVKYEL
jgi:hypothetical protein